MYREKGAATLTATIIILMLLSVLGITLLYLSKSSLKIATSFEKNEQAFNVAESGLENIVRTRLSTYNDLITYLFYNPSDLDSLPDPRFADFDALINGQGANGSLYSAYYSHFPFLKGSYVVDGGNPSDSSDDVVGEYYIRIIDNDIFINEDGDLFKNQLEDEDGDPSNGVVLANMRIDRDRNFFVQGRGIIRQGTRILGTKLITIRICAIEQASGTQKGGSAANANVAKRFCIQSNFIPQ
ncbi:pilus assembly PilX N-terminal domain-containing protein [Thermotomaculum hydrothermale]|nr:pilus assembly PilX N-terminal domain-containing protein [Thermotomaculum hydrothermale]